jgi:hypothetical protein
MSGLGLVSVRGSRGVGFRARGGLGLVCSGLGTGRLWGSCRPLCRFMSGSGLGGSGARAGSRLTGVLGFGLVVGSGFGVGPGVRVGFGVRG